MTLQAIGKQIEKALNAAKNPDGKSDYFSLLPRVPYSELPEKLKVEADKFTVETAKGFLISLYPVDTLSEIAKDAETFDNLILKALRTARYLIKSVDLTPPKLTGDPDIDKELLYELQPIALMGSDFVDAWEEVLGSPNARYGIIKQGPLTNAITKVRAQIGKNAALDPHSKEKEEAKKTAIIQGQSGLEIEIPRFGLVGAPATSTWQLFDMITEEFARSGDRFGGVAISFNKYMEQRGLKDRKEGMKQYSRDLEILRVSSVSFTEPKRRKGEPQVICKMNICSHIEILPRGNRIFHFNPNLSAILKNYPPMYYPKLLYRLRDRKNPNSYYFMRKIAEHKSMNIGKKNEDIISVKALLKASEYTTSKEAVTDRHYGTRIIKPFERDMNALSDTITWEYCHRNGKLLSSEELENMDYETFENCLIKVTWVDYPDQTKRRERIEKAREAKMKN